MTTSLIIHEAMFAIGLGMLFLIVRSMVHVGLMNRHDVDWFARVTSRIVRRLFFQHNRTKNSFPEFEKTMHWFLGAYILLLTSSYFFGSMIAFAFMYSGTKSVPSWYQAFIASGSALNTIGFATPSTRAGQLLAIPEGAFGLGIVVFLFTFVPNFQSAIRSRDDLTAWLYARLPNLTNSAELLEWCTRYKSDDAMNGIWENWENWFRQLADTHQSSPMLALVPSVQQGQSWIIAAAAVLDATSFWISTVESSSLEAARICNWTGTRATTLIADVLSEGTVKSESGAGGFSRNEYDSLCVKLSALGARLKSSGDTSWSEFCRLRSGYATAISYIAHQAFVPLVDEFAERQA